jgi:hypothetical protein
MSYRNKSPYGEFVNVRAIYARVAFCGFRLGRISINGFVEKEYFVARDLLSDNAKEIIPFP